MTSAQPQPDHNNQKLPIPPKNMATRLELHRNPNKLSPEVVQRITQKIKGSDERVFDLLGEIDAAIQHPKSVDYSANLRERVQQLHQETSKIIELARRYGDSSRTEYQTQESLAALCWSVKYITKYLAEQGLAIGVSEVVSPHQTQRFVRYLNQLDRFVPEIVSRLQTQLRDRLPKGRFNAYDLDNLDELEND
jgi:hypothetical protein